MSTHCDFYFNLRVCPFLHYYLLIKGRALFGFHAVQCRFMCNSCGDPTKIDRHMYTQIQTQTQTHRHRQTDIDTDQL